MQSLFDFLNSTLLTGLLIVLPALLLLLKVRADGLGTVLMPSVPTPMAGSIFIITSERVHPIDVPVTAMMKCISKWGSGRAQLLAGLKKTNTIKTQTILS